MKLSDWLRGPIPPDDRVIRAINAVIWITFAALMLAMALNTSVHIK